MSILYAAVLLFNIQSNNTAVHTETMNKTRELLSVLMEKSEHNPNSLSQALGKRVKQPQIHKFVKGITTEPKRSTLTPIAEYFGISVDAFFDEAQAEELLHQIESGSFVVQRQKSGGRTQASAGRAAPTSADFAAIEQALRLLADQIDQVSDTAQRQRIAQQLQILAMAPDSPKARHGVLEALAPWNAAKPAAETADFAGRPPSAAAIATGHPPGGLV